jgi:hypothetical protein
MSNHLAIATVTATLARLLQTAAAAAVPAADVRAGRPVNEAGIPPTRVYLYLYEVVPNAAMRNADLPTRNGNGDVVRRPQIALDLRYLISFSGNDEELEPQRMLGSVTRTLHARPLITHEMIDEVILDLDFLAESNLGDQVDRVKVVPLGLSLEEMTKLWSVFLQVPHLLSIAYQASVVLIESDVSPRSALPVAARNLYVVPFRAPFVDQVVSEAGPDRPVRLDDMILLRGRSLAEPNVRVRLGGLEAVPESSADTLVRIRLSSPPFAANSLRAGLQAVQLVYPAMMGSPAVAHRGVESNVATLLLRPRLTAPVAVANVVGAGVNPRSADLTITVEPVVGTSQRIELLLDQRADPLPASYVFRVATLVADAGVFVVPISGVVAGEYFVRLRVDGAESVLDLDPASPDFGPRVVIP